MFVVLLKYKKDAEEISKHFIDHIRFLNSNYTKKKIIFSGREIQKRGSVILAHNCDREYLENTIQEDPFYTNQIADYHIIEFEPTKYDTFFSHYVLKDI